MHLTRRSLDQVFEKSLMVLAFVADATILLLGLVLGRSCRLNEVAVTRLVTLAVSRARWLRVATRRALTRLRRRAFIRRLAGWLTANEERALSRYFLLALRFQRAHRYRLNFTNRRAEYVSCILIQCRLGMSLVHRVRQLLMLLSLHLF